MKLNHECVRDVLMAIEEQANTTLSLQSLNFPTVYTENEIIYTLEKLKEANFVNVTFKYASNKLYSCRISSLTWDGHAFLDTIRDDTVWAKTKSATEKLTSVSLNMLSSIGSEIVVKLLSGTN
ncbi:DUF2513 domain-containing protein [Brochothrix campestris]|uniref:DUF2513 domain-containing protein n=1 Tax=Brochothrix campestris FSL F6-1037 TaxID=1265861 RepID=W7CYY7_9LIST|nr:DUF2513 domain-containing protein [Brochothrix campestris]EUJ41960.1 hypothetical protein BCAMP_01075 [Brochothrix campestris FSL F6-1037]